MISLIFFLLLNHLFQFSTSNRATSICVALMFGRLGSVIGSNVSAILLNSYCEGAFYLSGSTLIGKFIISNRIYQFLHNLRLVRCMWEEKRIILVVSIGFIWRSMRVFDILHTENPRNTIKSVDKRYTDIITA